MTFENLCHTHIHDDDPFIVLTETNFFLLLFLQKQNLYFLLLFLQKQFFLLFLQKQNLLFLQKQIFFTYKEHIPVTQEPDLGKQAMEQYLCESPMRWTAE